MKLRRDWDMMAAVIGWLRYDRRCDLVCWERASACRGLYRPDVLGVTRQRYLVEVEVKRSMADFRANMSKKGWIDGSPLRPRQFYFAVTPDIVERVTAELPPGCGLLTMAPSSRFGPAVRCVKAAPTLKPSHRLSLREMVEMIRHQTGSLHRVAVALAMAQRRPT